MHLPLLPPTSSCARRFPLSCEAYFFLPSRERRACKTLKQQAASRAIAVPATEATTHNHRSVTCSGSDRLTVSTSPLPWRPRRPAMKSAYPHRAEEGFHEFWWAEGPSRQAE